MYYLQQKNSIFSKVQLKIFLSGEKIEREVACQGLSVKGSSQQSGTSGPKLREGAHLLWGDW